MKSDELMTVKDVARYLNVSTKTVYNMVRDERLPFIRVGGQYRFIREKIDSVLGDRSTTTPRWRARIANATSNLEKRLLFVGSLSKELEKKRIKPILVGGNAVEFYTAGGYATADIDLIAPSISVEEILRAWGFKKDGRYWFDKEAGLVVEIPDSVLAGDRDRVLAVDIEDVTCYLIGIEDLLVDRLNAAVHWQSQDDRHWAKELMRMHLEAIDWPYIEERCRKEGTRELLRQLRGEVKDHAPD